MSGICGVISKQDCAEKLFYGIDYHSHLGTEFGGIAMMDGERFSRQIHEIAQSQFKSKFFEDLPGLKGNKGIGVISDSNEQPIYLNSRFGPFCIVTMGLIENADALVAELLAAGHSFAEMSSTGPVNTTELIARLITLGDDLADGIERMFERIEGSCSLLILNKDGIYAARDRRGYTPLVIGKHADTYAVTSETSAFPNTDLKVVKFMAPGEIILVTENGIASKREGNAEMQICSFLWIYTGFPASDYEGINTEAVRERCGAALARRDRDISVDVVAGVPDSGTSHAIGYAMESGKPFRRPLVKYTPGYGRSYTPPIQQQRDLIAKMKLIPIREIINGNRIAVLDDSIVRGTQLKNFTINKLWDAGAKEVHVRPASPPLMFPCKFCLATRSIHELAARKAIHNIEGRDVEDVSEYIDSGSPKHQKMVDSIAHDLGATTLRYQTVDDMVEAIGLPREKLCLYCWTGECPSSGNKEKGNACRASCGKD
ncbi:MAG TPA: amidophosphoribosyltransferase [Candidatus Omnitrophota bacterium]|jgi:amidophosphoribosyltransferase|nr:MAG: Amidophosphoribosyltransferase precursor [Candidatus Omnitrophica bacterium ADurb.Bin314]HOE69173.1 amidophosphoribosyltransferase [Candidatus Omnitrophota bacterium]HPW65041.1 amidophosphoribosyltransferase [Candidatus Omnitrophota bacterium]HQB94645.1 amidophosphoribosyltransferase [Candidatus Omnitrophota bacterium]